MEYVVMQDYYSNEFDFELREGEIVDETFFASEPDLVGNLVAAGVLADASTAEPISAEEAAGLPPAELKQVDEYEVVDIVEDEAAELSEDEEAPRRRGR